MRDVLRNLAWAFCLAALLAPMPVFAADGAGAGASAASQGATSEGATQTRALLDIIRDDAARARLIAELEGVVRAVDAPVAEAASGDAPPVAISAGRALAEHTQKMAQSIAADLTLLWSRIEDIPRKFEGLTGSEVGVLYEALLNLALVIATTVGVFVVLRLFAKRLYRSMGDAAASAGFAQKSLLIVASNVVDVAVVLAAWASGFVWATLFLGQFGEIGIRQTLYLNAFLIVELAKVVVRAFLAPTTGALRLISIPDAGARVLSWWLSVVVSIVGYGQLLMTPIINNQISYFAGRSFSSLLLLAAIVILATLALRFRKDVAGWLLGARGVGGRRGLLPTLARYWHVPALAYLAGVFIVVMAQSGGDVLPVLSASGQVLLAVLFGVLTAQSLKRSIAAGVRLPESVNQRLPLLERRLNAFVPRTLFVLRLAIIAAVAAFTANTLGLLSVEDGLGGPFGVRLAGVAISIAAMLLIAFAAWLALSSYVDYRLNPDYGSRPTSREETLLTLLRNAVTIVLVVITLMFVLSELGVDIAPLLASAGVLGLAIGFGAQKLVQDIITGIFIQLENAVNVGDIITVGGVTGTVERLTIRSVSLRDVAGTFHIIPFSSIDMVSNFMRDFAYFVADMGIAYRESVDEAKQAMQEAFEELRSAHPMGAEVIGDLEWWGLNTFGDSAVVVRARIKCRPGKQWAVGRAYNEIVKRIFDARGIEIPFPHQTIYFGEDKDGCAPPLRAIGLEERFLSPRGDERPAPQTFSASGA